MRRRWVIAITLGCLAVGAAVAYPALSPGPRIDTSPEAFFKLRYGMTRGEVEAILGGPPGDYGTDPDTPGARIVRGSWCCRGGEIPGALRSHHWITDDGWAWVAFDENGKVDYLDWMRVKPPRPWPVRNGPLVMFVAYTVLFVAAAAWLSR